MRDLCGMFVASVIICVFAASMFLISCYNPETKDLDIEATVEQNIYHTEMAVCTLVDTERDEVAVRRRHGYYNHKTMLMFYLQVQATNKIYAFSVPQSVWDSYRCGNTVYVNVDVFGKSKIYSINDHSVNCEYQLGWFEETPVKRISSHLLSEQAKQTEVVTTEEQTEGEQDEKDN